MEYGFAVYFFIKIAFNSIKIKPLHFITYLFSCNIHIGSLSHLCNCWFVEAKKLTQYFLVSGSLRITIGGGCGPILGLFLPNLGEGSLLIYYPFEVAVLIEFLLLNTGFAMKNKILQQLVIKALQEIIKRYEKKKIVD
jgi:hypothetical protein